MRYSFALLLALAACGDKDTTPDDTATDDTATDDTAAVDNDGDGVTADEDCDDDNADVFPGAVEVCNGVDDDCDGDTDDADSSLDLSSAGTWYGDNDGDGFGAPDASTEACAAPEGSVADNTDCDDDDPAVNPDADEVCDGADNDCDGDVDDADDSLDASTGEAWYTDGDGDGFGDPATEVMTCERPDGAVGDGTDCDDSDPEVSPIGIEVCNEDDDDCDGLVDDADDSLDTSTAVPWYLDADTDGYGDPNESALSCAQPSGRVADQTDCDDGDASVNPGATDTPQDGFDQDCDGSDAAYGVTDLGPGDLQITEVMQNPTAANDSVGEWFEVRNTSGGLVDLDGLYVADDGSDSFTVSGQLLVADGAYAVFAINGDSTANGGVTASYVYSSFFLGNSDDEIHLCSDSTRTTCFDAVLYDNGATYPDPAGASMALDITRYGVTNPTGADWCTSTTVFGAGDRGTPGADNDNCLPQ